MKNNDNYKLTNKHKRKQNCCFCMSYFLWKSVKTVEGKLTVLEGTIDYIPRKW